MPLNTFVENNVYRTLETKRSNEIEGANCPSLHVNYSTYLSFSANFVLRYRHRNMYYSYSIPRKLQNGLFHPKRFLLVAESFCQIEHSTVFRKLTPEFFTEL